MHGVWIARLAHRGTTVSAAYFVVGVASFGYVLSLNPGVTEDIAVSFPTSACDPTVSFQIPPGEYDLYVVIDQPGDAMNVPDDTFALGPVPITVIDP